MEQQYIVISRSMLCFQDYIIRSYMNVCSEIHTFIGLLNMVTTNYFEMAWCFEILILSWIWALCLLQLAFWCYMLSLIFLWAWKRLRGSLELLWSSPAIHNNWKMVIFISNKFYNSMEDWCVDQNLFSASKSLIKAWVHGVSSVWGRFLFTNKMTTLLLHEDMRHIQFGGVVFDILCA